MQYLPAFNINDSGIYEALRCGQLRLQPGQWVWTCDSRIGKPSRFVDAVPGYMNIVHAGGAFNQGRFPVEKFQARCRIRRANLCGLKRTKMSCRPFLTGVSHEEVTPQDQARQDLDRGQARNEGPAPARPAAHPPHGCVVLN
jgi:hypothetical protein